MASTLYFLFLVNLFIYGVFSKHLKDIESWNFNIISNTREKEDPEVGMNVSQIITFHGYPCEEYDVYTKDGYILNIQRIPASKHAKNRDAPPPVILLQHGLLSSSADWVLNPVNESFAFQLADAGVDVWLGNSRGNTYALRHETFSPDDEEFWDFSWDEMARYDLPATIDKVLEVTGSQQLVYTGFSQGTQIAFAQLSHDKQLSEKIKLFVALAPVAYLSHVRSPLKYLAPFANDVGFLFRLFGVKDFLPSDWIFHWLAQNVCGHSIPDVLCENILFLFGGFDYKHMNMSRIPVYVSHAPAGTSVRNIIHYAQSIRTGQFKMFDFGKEENQRRYNQTTPPRYDPSRINVDIALYSGGADWLATPSDVKKLKSILKHAIHHVTIPDWEHLDFTWGTNAPRVCYDDIIDLIIQMYNLTPEN